MTKKWFPILAIFLALTTLIVVPIHVDAAPILDNNISTVASLSFDWSIFWQQFKNHSAWDLEWFDGVNWISIKGDLSIVRAFPNQTTCKITLIFDASHSGNYRLTFAIDEKIRDYVQKIDKFQYELLYDGYSIVFDWSDCAEIVGLVFSHGVKEIDGERFFWFRIRRDGIPIGAHIKIDPAVVATSSSYLAVSYPYQRKGFYANTRFWAFYVDSGTAYYESTTDPSDWSGSATSIGACTYGYEFSIWFDGTYIHYARYSAYYLKYRRGIPQSSGSISWSAVEQTVYYVGSSDYMHLPCITVDSGGYAWIGCVRYYNGLSYAKALKNSQNDGTWTTGINYTLTTTDSASWVVEIVPLTSLKVYVIYVYNGIAPKGKLYSGGWSSEETDLADYTLATSYLFSAVNEGDHVHFTYTRATTEQIRYNKRTYGVGWGATDVLVAASVDETYMAPALSINTANNNLYCFWMQIGTDHVYYKKCVSGTWDTNPTDWQDESTDYISYGYLFTSWYQDYGGYIGLLYVTKASAPYNIKFAYLTMAAGYALNLRVMDFDLTDAISGAVVYKDSDYLTSDAEGWANWTGVSGTVSIEVTYFGFTVNTTSYTVTSDTTDDLHCNLYDTTVTAKPNNNQGILSGANVTAYNNTGTSIGKIKSGITADITGAVTLTNLPNATLRFIVYAKSDYSVIIANTTQSITSDGYSFNIVADQNYATTTLSWDYVIIWAGGLSILSLGTLPIILRKFKKQKKGGEKTCMQRKYA